MRSVAERSRRNRRRAAPTVNLTYLGEFFGLLKTEDPLNLLEKILVGGARHRQASTSYGCSHLYILSTIDYT
jgi:hypothetical protein